MVGQLLSEKVGHFMSGLMFCKNLITKLLNASLSAIVRTQQCIKLSKHAVLLLEVGKFYRTHMNPSHLASDTTPHQIPILQDLKALNTPADFEIDPF